MKKRWMAFTLVLALLLCGHAVAEEAVPDAAPTPVMEDRSLELLGSSVHCPRITGLEDEEKQAAINERIMTAGGFQAYFDRMALLISDPTGLTVTYDARIAGDLFLCVAEASGAVVNSRPTHVWTAANIDLTDGHLIGWEDLFTEPEEALEAIGEYLDENVAPELSAHLSAGSLAPLPEVFGLSPYGLTLLYPIEQLSTLQDKAGAVEVHWSEIRDYLRLEEGSVLDRVGAAENLIFSQDALAALGEALGGGSIPGIPAAIGESVQELTDRYGLQIDPDLYEGGRMFLPDDSAFRQVWLLSDALLSGWEQSTVQGLRADRLNLRGLQTGITTREDYLAALGEPESTLNVDEERALNWRIVPGTSDYYTLGEYRLRLHADEEGILQSVFLTR